MSSPSISFRWPAEFVARIDGVRGDVPRSAYVRRALERQMAHDETAVAARQAGLDALANQPLAAITQAMRTYDARIPGLGKGPVAPRPKGSK